MEEPGWDGEATGGRSSVLCARTLCVGRAPRAGGGKGDGKASLARGREGGARPRKDGLSPRGKEVGPCPRIWKVLGI